jgi:hypothetical protein
MSKKSNLSKAPTYYRAPVGRGLSATSGVLNAGGRFGAGLITGLAVITRGEALGHEAWVDTTFISEVNAALKVADAGIKSRYTHPDMSGDGLAKGLGRVTWAPSDSPDVVRGDLHFWKSSRKTPDGDLGEHIIERASEDPSSFGASISFSRDVEAEIKFMLQNGATIDRDGNVDLSRFKSPDPQNVNNYPHVRLAKLRAVDIVDDPAANPDGLFARDEVFQEAEALLSYLTGETTGKKPELVTLGVDPERASGFLKRFLSTRGLSIVKANEMGKLAEGNFSEPTEVAEVVETPVAVEPVAEATSEAVPEVKPANAVEFSSADPREEVKRFVCEFGEQGAFWYIEGISFAEAQSRRLQQLQSENEKLKKELELSKQSESVPLSQGGGDPASTSKVRGGFVSNIRLKA